MKKMNATVAVAALHENRFMEIPTLKSLFIDINKAVLAAHSRYTDAIRHPASNIYTEGGRRPDKEMGTKGEMMKGMRKSE